MWTEHPVRNRGNADYGLSASERSSLNRATRVGLFQRLRVEKDHRLHEIPYLDIIPGGSGGSTAGSASALCEQQKDNTDESSSLTISQTAKQ